MSLGFSGFVFVVGLGDFLGLVGGGVWFFFFSAIAPRF